MKVLLASIPLTGHFNPILAAAAILQKSGCETAIYTSVIFREKVEQAGIRFIALPEDADEGAREFLGAFLKKHKGAPSNEDLVNAFVGFFVAPMTSQYRGLQAALMAFPADVVVHETCFTGVFPMLLGPRSERPVSVHLGVIPLRLERADGAPWGPGFLPTNDLAEREGYAEAARLQYESRERPLQQAANTLLSELGLPSLLLCVRIVERDKGFFKGGRGKQVCIVNGDDQFGDSFLSRNVSLLGANAGNLI